jgi:hypothetical protein
MRSSLTTMRVPSRKCTEHSRFGAAPGGLAITARYGARMLVHHNPEAVRLGINPFDHGSEVHTDLWRTQGLRQALEQYRFDWGSPCSSARRAP